MLNKSLHGLTHLVNGVRKTVAANVIYMVLVPVIGDDLVLCHLTTSQATQSRYSLIERVSAVGRDIILDSSDFSSEVVDLAVKSVTDLAERGAFHPRAKLSHESLELSDASFPGALRRILSGVFGGAVLASRLQDMEEVTSQKSDNARDDESDIFSGHFWMIISGLLGWIAYGVIREWQLRTKDRSLKLPERSWPNTL